MPRIRTLAVLIGLGVAAAAAVRHGRGVALGHCVPGGILIGNVGAYDFLTRHLLRSLFDGVAADVAAASTRGARVLEVGCGPGHLSTRLAGEHGLDVTGLDLDPTMIERAQANADRPSAGDEHRPSFVVGDAAALPFGDESFDLVISTFSMHHWADPDAGLAEIGRVLRPGSRALIWDFPSAFQHPFAPRNRLVPGQVEQTRDLPLRLVSATPWRWPWQLRIIQRTELVR